MDITTVSTVVAIVVITYLIGLGAKAIPHIKDNYIPIIVGTAGGILGIIGMYVIPDFPANDILNAIAVGIVSGLSSTGVNQIYKQVKNSIRFKDRQYLFTKEMMTAISFMKDIPTQRVTSFLILMMREIKFPKFLKKKQAFQSQLTSKQT